MNTTITDAERVTIAVETIGYTQRERDIYAAGFIATRLAREDGDRRVAAERERCAAIVRRYASHDCETAMLEAIADGEKPAGM